MEHKLTKRDQFLITMAIDLAGNHSSGGSYNMVALWAKGSNIRIGYNELYRQANRTSQIYPEICGTHAELDLYRRMGADMRGGRLYVGGRKQSNNAIMMNTKPCVYCAQLLSTTKTNWIIYIDNTTFTKNKVEDLLS